MTSVHRISVVTQTAGFLREGLAAGRWKARLPGLRKLAEELGVSRESLRPALALLVAEGLLREGGKNEPHEIVPRKRKAPAPDKPRSLRVAMLLIQPLTLADSTNQLCLSRIAGILQADGHTCVFVSPPANRDMHKPGFLPRLVAETGADAWLIQIGTKEVLEWFVGKRLPVLALGGACLSLPIAAAGRYTGPALRESVRKLVALGHRRIVYISPEFLKHPEPAPSLCAFREALQEAGIRPSEYNTPEWEETPEGLDRLLDSLFRITPPTALICWNTKNAMGSITFLAHRRLRIPGDVSVISVQLDPDAEWMFPNLKIAHFENDDASFCRRVRQWVHSAATGRPDTRQVWDTGRFVEGNTIAPPKQG